MEIFDNILPPPEDLKVIMTKLKALEVKEGGRLMEEQPLSPAACLFHQPHFNCHILAIMGSNTKINFEAVRAGLEKTLIKHPRFSSIQVLDKSKNFDKMKWVPTLVNLDDHICVPDLDPNMEEADKYVEDYICDLTKTTLDMSKPLWDLHLLNVKIKNAEAVGIFRIHHSLGDGASLMSLLLSLTRKTSDPNALPTVPVKKATDSKKDHKLWFLFMVIWVIWLIIQLVRNTLIDIIAAICSVVFLRDSQTHLRGEPGAVYAYKRIVYRTVSLDDIKMVKNTMGVTINDVVLGVTAAGLSRYLNRRYGEKKPRGLIVRRKSGLPKNIRLRATLLVNIRPSVGIQALADMMEKNRVDAQWGNWLGIVLLPFHIVLRDDPLDYVRDAKAVIDRKKLSLEAIYTFASAALVVKSIGIKVASFFAKQLLRQTTMTFSNVVGPLEEISFYGHSMTFLAPSVYGHPQGVTIHFQSYIDKMTIVLGVDEKCVPDPHQLCDDMEESLKLITNAAIAKRG
ncbi:hypothetical protein ACHQM5_011198 [Ranunculus cassubicifolius]